MSESVTPAEALSILRKAMNDVVEHWTEQFERRGHAAPAWCLGARKALEDTAHLANPAPIDFLSDNETWHIIVKAATKSGGNLYDLSQDECVTDVRASFLNPDAGRELLKQAAASRPTLYYVGASTPDESNVDLLVRATSPEEAETLWRQYYDGWDLPRQPWYIKAVPVTGPVGAIRWSELHPTEPPAEDDEARPLAY